MTQPVPQTPEAIAVYKNQVKAVQQPFSINPTYQRVEKPWGHEIVWTIPEAPACGKFLFVKAGHKLSLQWHDEKTETLCLISGKANFVLEDENGQMQEIPMESQKGYFVQRGQLHRVVSVEDCMIVESSTPETGNTFRVEDDFARPTETEDLRSQENRGWQG